MAEMNEYAVMARRAWEQFRPQELQQMQDPDTFFSSLGRQAQREIETRSRALAGADTPGEGYMHKLRRLQTARFQARGQVIRELILLTDQDETATATSED